MDSIYDVSVQCRSCNEIVDVDPPENRMIYAVTLSLILGTIGFLLGFTVGLATAGFGMAAFPFTTLIGLYAGYRMGDWGAEKWHGISCSGCGDHVASG